MNKISLNFVYMYK